MYIVLSTVQHYSILSIFLVQIQRNNDKRCKNRDNDGIRKSFCVKCVYIKKRRKGKKVYIVVLISIFSFQIFGNTTTRRTIIYFHHLSVSLNLRLLHLILLDLFVMEFIFDIQLTMN